MNITNNWLALTAFLAILISLFDDFFSKDKKIRKTKVWLSILLALVVLGLTIKKNDDDSIIEGEKINKIDSLSNNIELLQKGNKEMSDKLSWTNVYLKKLDTIGVKRDSLNNQPIIEKSIINYITKVQNLYQ